MRPLFSARHWLFVVALAAVLAMAISGCEAQATPAERLLCRWEVALAIATLLVLSATLFRECQEAARREFRRQMWFDTHTEVLKAILFENPALDRNPAVRRDLLREEMFEIWHMSASEEASLRELRAGTRWDPDRGAHAFGAYTATPEVAASDRAARGGERRG